MDTDDESKRAMFRLNDALMTLRILDFDQWHYVMWEITARE